MLILLLGLIALPATLALPPLGSEVFIVPAKNALNQALRHCNYVASFDGVEAGSDDFRFTLIAALNGAPGVSFRSVNFPAQYLTYKNTGLPVGSRVGIAASADVATASWTVTPTGSADGAVMLTTQSTLPGLVGRRLTLANNASGPCNNGRNHDARLEAAQGGSSSAQSFIVQTQQPTPGPSPSPAPAPVPVPATITIDATTSDHTIPAAIRGW